MAHETATPQQATPNPAPLWRRIWKWVLGGGLIVLVVGLVAFVASLTGILSYLGITPPTRAPQVEITHIEHPAGRAIEGEYVRIENKGKSEIEMSGWTLSDEEDKHTFLFPPFTLKAGAAVQVWTKSGTNTETDLYWGWGSPVWDDDEDTAYLRDATGTQVCSSSYR